MRAEFLLLESGSPYPELSSSLLRTSRLAKRLESTYIAGHGDPGGHWHTPTPLLVVTSYVLYVFARRRDIEAAWLHDAASRQRLSDKLRAGLRWTYRVVADTCS